MTVSPWKAKEKESKVRARLGGRSHLVDPA
jgi:hypothetical protein